MKSSPKFAHLLFAEWTYIPAISFFLMMLIIISDRIERFTDLYEPVTYPEWDLIRRYRGRQEFGHYWHHEGGKRSADI